jgi:hypothetical protein
MLASRLMINNTYNTDPVIDQTLEKSTVHLIIALFFILSINLSPVYHSNEVK